MDENYLWLLTDTSATVLLRQRVSTDRMKEKIARDVVCISCRRQTAIRPAALNGALSHKPSEGSGGGGGEMRDKTSLAAGSVFKQCTVAVRRQPVSQIRACAPVLAMCVHTHIHTHTRTHARTHTHK